MSAHNHDCLFCKIIRGELPSTKVFENDRIVAFRDIVPSAKEHILFVPKKHIANLNDAVAEDFPLFGEMLQAIQQVVQQLGIAESGYRIVNNCNKDSGQIVYHIHFHLLGGERLGDMNGDVIHV